MVATIPIRLDDLAALQDASPDFAAAALAWDAYSHLGGQDPQAGLEYFVGRVANYPGPPKPPPDDEATEIRRVAVGAALAPRPLDRRPVGDHGIPEAVLR